jgi:membrane protein
MSAEPSPVTRADQQPVDDPTDLTRADYKVALTATVREVKRDDVPSMAAGVAFKIFLALFPSLIAAVAIFGFFADPAQLDTYLANLEGIVPEDALGLIERGLANITETGGGAAGGLAITGILGGLWAASSAAATLVKALNRAYETEEARSFIKQRLVALSITGALLLAIGALITLVIAGPQVQRLVVPEQLQGTAANIAFGVAQGLLVLLVLVLLFAFVYWIGPNRELPEWKWMSPGALLGVVGWIVASLAFTLYVQNFGNYDNGTYAGLGGVIVFMLWLQISMLILLVGAEFNAEVERLKAQHEAVRTGAGMGHLAEPSSIDTDGSPDAAAVISLPEAAAVGAAPQRPSRARASEGGAQAPARDGGGGDATRDTARAAAIATGAVPDPAAGVHGNGRSSSSRAVAAGVAAAAAAVAAVVVRRVRD